MARRRKKRRKNPALLLVRNPSKRRRKKVAKRPRRARRKNPSRRRRAPSSGISAILRQRSVTVAQLRAVAKQDKEFAAALSRYKRFHGSWPDSIEVMDLPGVKNPGFRYAVGLGDTRAHEYEVPRSSGRKGLPFRHAFKKGRQITATDPWGKGLYVLKRKGSTLRVTDRGIRDD